MGNKRKLHLTIFPHLHIAKVMCISLTFASYLRMMQMYFYIDNLLNLPKQIQWGEHFKFGKSTANGWKIHQSLVDECIYLQCKFWYLNSGVVFHFNGGNSFFQLLKILTISQVLQYKVDRPSSSKQLSTS